VAPGGGSSHTARCGKGDRAERFVGRCESDSFSEFPGCDEGKPPNETSYLTVFGPDENDSPCVDMYTNQVFEFEGHYLAVPAAYEHLPGAPTWIMDNDGTFDTRLLHSRDGKRWQYVNGDRAPWLARGPSAGPPVYSRDEVPGATQASCWRESMAAAVRGYVVRNEKILMYSWGCRCRHGQDGATTSDGGGGAIARLSLRMDGFASIGSPNDSGWDAQATFVTTPLLVPRKAQRLLLNAVSANGGQILVGLRRPTPGAASGIAIPGFEVNQSIPVVGDFLSAGASWREVGYSMSGALSGGRALQLEFSVRGAARLYSYRFE
jgi:hypothetical protein